MDFAASEFRQVVTGGEILEVGSHDVNGNVRALSRVALPNSYTGADISSGPGVDVICDVSQLVERFGLETFDVVLSTEMLEHVQDWRCAVSQMKAVLRPGGRMILTTRSPGFALHGYPADYWRFTMEDMSLIFSDFDNLNMVVDSPLSPGIFVAGTKARRSATPLEAISIYSVVTRCRRNRATIIDRIGSTVLVAAKNHFPQWARRLGRGLLKALRAGQLRLSH